MNIAIDFFNDLDISGLGAQGVSCFAAPKVLEVGHRCGGAVQAPSSSLEVLAASHMKPRPPWAATATEFQDKATIVRQETIGNQQQHVVKEMP